MASKAQELHEIEKVGIRERQPRSRQNCEEDLKREAATPPDSLGLTRLQLQIRSTPKDSGFVLLEMVVKDEWTRAMMSLKDLIDHPHGWFLSTKGYPHFHHAYSFSLKKNKGCLEKSKDRGAKQK
ncbi:hypothetical protein ACFX10_001811 [Malus domestica]